MGRLSFKKFKREIGMDNTEPTWTEEMDEMVTLTKMQRVYGFCICVALGICFSILSTLFLVDLADGDPVPFAVCYTIGNLLSLGSSFFLVGPWKQAKRMFEKKRYLATIFYLIAIILTLYVAFDQPCPNTGLNALIIILLVLVQAAALFWYTLTYIPYGRTAFKKLVGVV
eukprot:Rmarinus@m.27508